MYRHVGLGEGCLAVWFPEGDAHQGARDRARRDDDRRRVRSIGGSLDAADFVSVSVVAIQLREFDGVAAGVAEANCEVPELRGVGGAVDIYLAGGGHGADLISEALGGDWAAGGRDSREIWLEGPVEGMSVRRGSTRGCVRRAAVSALELNGIRGGG